MDINKAKASIISLEGGDNCGKSTQCSLLFQSLSNATYQALFTREPGGSKNAELLREIIFSNNFDNLTEILLFIASRRINYQETIVPIINDYHFILTDRSVLSTIVYQGYVNDLDPIVIKNLHQIFNFNLYPELTIILDIDIDISKTRMLHKTQTNRIDYQSYNFHTKVIQGYKQFKSFNLPNTIQLIDGRADIATVHGNIINIINEHFKSNLQPVI